MQLNSKASASNQLDAHDADELLIVHRCNTPEANCSHKHAVLWRGAADGSGARALDKSHSLTQHTRAGAGMHAHTHATMHARAHPQAMLHASRRVHTDADQTKSAVNRA